MNQSKNKETKPLLIGQLAKLVGVKPDSVRFYERVGLLPKAKRLASGYRVYSTPALNRLRFIKKAQVVGFSLDEIRRILNLRQQGQSACDSVVSMAEATLTETEEKVKNLQAFADNLRKNLKRWRGVSACKSEFCSLIESSVPNSDFPSKNSR